MLMWWVMLRVMSRHQVLLGFLFVSMVVPSGLAQKPSSFDKEDEGPISVVRDHARWVSPEAVVNDLRSKDETVRLAGFERLGLTDEQAYTNVWSQTSDSHLIGKVVLTPDQVRLTYAVLGEDATQQAILAVAVDAMQEMFVAIATPVQGGWERVATADCWCKYDLGGDALGEFVHVENLHEPMEPEPTRFQLVIRASGGGSGVYQQDEGHFVMHGGELRRVLSFTSRYRSCPPTGPTPTLCTIERRWFNPNPVNGRIGGVLVESYGKFPGDSQPAAFWAVRDLEIRKLQDIKCTSYWWDEQGFRYVPTKGLPAGKMCP
ncbi:MAG TPA: hypothetical protein VK578_03065 [Edaphobacter sp.]|nr:hypothetical protein [Edaphobacter sp.]